MGLPLQELDTLTPLGPMPRLDPIDRFVPPIDPWNPGGYGWNVAALDDQGDPLCVTNRRPTPACDPDGPRAFLHAGFDAAPAPDRVVRASAAGRVVVAQATTAYVTGRSEGEGGGIVVLEHDRDGDPATTNDRLLTVYGHVDPQVSVGQIVGQGDRIALTSTQRGNHLHFAVRQGAYNFSDLDVLRAFLPPSGTSGCVACYSRAVPAPAFPDLWQDPAQLLTGSPFWLQILGAPEEGASDILETSDGSMAFGYTWNQPGTPGRSMAVRQLDHEGKIVAQRAYYASSRDTIKHVERTQDGGVIALAVSYTTGFVSIPMLVKFDAGGAPLWARQYGLQANGAVVPTGLWWEDIAVTADGGYVVTGTGRFTNSVPASALVARLDAAGNVLWVRTYDPVFVNPGTDGKRIAPTSDGGFVVVAEYQVSIGLPNYIVKDLVAFRIDAAGNVLWGTLLGNGSNDSRAGQIVTTPDGGSIVVAYRSLFSFLLPVATWVVKLNGDGTIAWSSLYFDSSGDFEETGARIALTSDGGAVVAGTRTTFVNPYVPQTDLFLMRLDGAGEIVAQRRLDSLGQLTTPLGLRAATQGFLLAGGVDGDCHMCGLESEDAARFVVAHLDDHLDCQGLCTAPDDFTRQPGPPSGGAIGFRVSDRTGTSVDTPLTGVDTTVGRSPCGQGFFGSPPAIESSSFAAAPRTVSCDRTQFVEAYVCAVGGINAQATSPVIVNVTYDSLPLTAHVVDGDSTPAQNDVVRVGMSVAPTYQPFDPGRAIPVLDDGSTIPLPDLGTTVAVCADDPLSGVCGCRGQSALAFSGDAVAGDDVYTLDMALTLSLTGNPDLDVAKGCIFENKPRGAMLFANPGIPLFFTLQAIDHLGNIVSTTQTVTPSATTTSCTGDACGCCLLLQRDITQCAGLPGMPSPDLPDGLCRAF